MELVANHFLEDRKMVIRKQKDNASGIGCKNPIHTVK